MPQINDAKAHRGIWSNRLKIGKTQSRCKRSRNRREVMSSISQKAAHLFGAVVLIGLIGTAETRAEEAGASATYKDIEATLGIVPGFFKAFPLNGMQIDLAAFKSDTDTVVKLAGEKAKKNNRGNPNAGP